MKKILFACDMDNTLIHSLRFYKENDINVEIYNNREISFMSSDSVELLNELLESDRVDFLPVTTRSIEQFLRIKLPSQVDTALVCNGTILLKNGVPDLDWQKEVISETEKYIPEMKRLLTKYSESDIFKTIKIVDGIFLFAAVENSDKLEYLAEDIKKETTLDLKFQGRKIYWFSPIANKGVSLKRYCDTFGYEKVIAAGDSSIDYPMLNFADIALVPDEKIADNIKTSKIEICKEDNFSEFILHFVLNQIKNF